MRNLLRKNSVQLGLLLATLCILFVAITPKITRTIFPSSASNSWIEFKKEIIQTQKLDSQEYWEFREFYSPGVYTVNKQGLENNAIKSFYSTLPAGLQSQPELTFATFESPRLQSIDGLINRSSISEFVNLEGLNKSQIVKQTDKFLLYQLEDNQFVLISIFTPEQMKTANGFWDYQKDQDIIENRYWVSAALITVD